MGKFLLTFVLSSCRIGLALDLHQYRYRSRGPAMQRAHSILVLFLAMAVLVSGVAARHPQSSDGSCEYFPETGHRVCDEFLDFFNERGGLEIFGYPLTEAFKDETHGGRYVQYFQRTRMELYPENSDRYRVQLGLLVEELGYEFPPARPERVPASNGALHHYFPETEHVVSFAFLDYFRDHGGLDIFGYPRSEFMYEGGRVVQYFQRGRMEWHPESSVGSQMRLANLGEVYIERFGVPGNADEPVPAPLRYDETSVLDLNVSASVRDVITGRQGTQTLFVYVTNSQQRPVEGVSVMMIAHYPSGSQHLELDSTDEDGFTKGTFEILLTSPGKRVVVDVTAENGPSTGATQTFFLPWW